MRSPYPIIFWNSGRRSMIFRHELVAMVYSQPRNEVRRSKPGIPRQARTRASCSASSASAGDP